MKVVLFGDSVTEGCFDITKINGEIVIVRDVPCVYGSLLEKELKKKYPNKDIQFVNHGLSGRTTEEGLKCFKDLVLDENPDLVIMCFGLNDICGGDVEAYRKGQSFMFNELAKRKIKTIFMTPNTANYYVSKYELPELVQTAKDFANAQTSGTFDKFMDVIRAEAKKYGVYLVDAYKVWKKLDEYGVDTSLLLCNYINHPSRAMHHLFKDMLLDCIEKNNLLD